jgi:hypothetical protein
VEHLLGYLHTGKDTLFLDEQLALAHTVGWNATQCGVVTITNILAEGQVYQSFVQFFYTKHNCMFLLFVFRFIILPLTR